MYRQIESYLALRKITKRELARRLEVSYNTVLARMNGTSSFTLDEAVRLREILGCSESIEQLFSGAMEQREVTTPKQK